MKIFTLQKHVIFSSEQIILFGLLDKLIKEQPHCYNFNGKSRYDGLINYCKFKFTYVDDCLNTDIIVLPYKFKGVNDKIYLYLNNLSQIHNKPLWCFYNDDDDSNYSITSNVTLFRTSFYNLTKLKNERSLIAFSPDYFKGNIIQQPILKIGYCGHILHGRKKYIEMLLKSDIKTDFKLRKGFWAPGINKQQARKEYFTNMENNIFTFCYRGAGNFSYRFYETLMMGRIPILINTDCVFPFWNEIKSKNIGLILDDDINFIENIKKYYEKNKNNLVNIQINNRKLWEKYYSPIGFLENITHNI